jgi:hypothetical protein
VYTQTPPHPRAGVAVGLAVAAAWLGAFGIALATGEPADEQGAPPAAEVRSDLAR